MAREPWELTQAFAEQLMRQAAQTEQQATRVQLAPIEQAMALDRLKQQGELELSQLPRRLSIEDANKQLGENRAYQRTKELKSEDEQADIRKEKRTAEQLPSTLRAKTDAAIAAARGDKELEVEIYRKYGEEAEKAARAAKGGFGTHGSSSADNPLRPPTRPGHEPPEVLPTNTFDRNQYIQDLKDSGYEVTAKEGYRGHNYVHYKKKPESTKEPAPEKKKEEVKSGPSLGRRLLDKLTGPSAPPVAGPPPTAGAAPTADKIIEPVSNRSAGSLPFDAVGAKKATDLPEAAKAIPSLIGDTRLPLPEMKGDPIAGKDKMSFLYESIRRRGYTDDEAKTILARVIDKPETKPTDDPDVFDVLVA